MFFDNLKLFILTYDILFKLEEDERVKISQIKEKERSKASEEIEKFKELQKITAV